MAWKIEKWITEVFPGEDRVYLEYRDLPRRELAVVAAGVLDAALAELLSKRLLDLPKECENFLGLNEDGRAPAGTFGARIQLALLLGVITDRDAAILRELKQIRNKFSHRVKVDFTSPAVKPHVLRLHQAFASRITALLLPVVGNPERADELGAAFEASPEAGAGLLLAVLAVYQAYFHRLFPHVARVPSIHIPEAPHMKFVLLGPGRDSFREALCAAGIQFEEQPMSPQPGEIVNSAGEVIQIIDHSASSGATLAAVTCGWLKAQPTRTINITTKDNKVIHTADLNVKELEQFLEVARKVMIVDTDRSLTKADGGG